MQQTDFDTILTQLKNNAKTHLDLENAELTDEQLRQLADALPHCTNLVSINLTANDLSEDRLSIIAPSLEKLSNLTELNLSHNEFGKNDINTLSTLLEKLPNLQHLKLNNTQIAINDTNIKTLAASLQKLDHLVALQLSGNFLMPNHVSYLENAFENHLNIMDIDLSAPQLTAICQKNTASAESLLYKILRSQAVTPAEIRPQKAALLNIAHSPAYSSYQFANRINTLSAQYVDLGAATNLETLRPVLRSAAKAGQWDEITKILHNSNERLTYTDYMQSPDGQQSLLEILTEQKRLNSVFTPELVMNAFLSNDLQMRRVIESVPPEELRAQLGINVTAEKTRV